MAPNEKKPRANKPKAATPTKAATRTRKPKAVKPPAATELRFEHVAERAYYLWLEGSGGDPTAHWLQAERELAAA
jgi:Protein of unknown function (DUF2934)